VASWCLQRSIIAVDDSVGCKYEVMMEVFDYFEKFSNVALENDRRSGELPYGNGKQYIDTNFFLLLF